ncbi:MULTISPECIES: hypothetical protein [Spirulina sp. CCY15215]|uniref:hypothetical protein n=1 Tax=Spirulina sp. CCY15215 TaxID=2767591 RepID=UPI00194DC23D|nr:hypothetical protein [Spirulina major]
MGNRLKKPRHLISKTPSDYQGDRDYPAPFPRKTKQVKQIERQKYPYKFKEQIEDKD